MRPALLSATIVGAWLSLPAQDLVPNPGFEVFSSCPTFASMLDSAPPWSNPTAGTPELYHACAGSHTYAGVPANISGGFQVPHGGNGYAGLFTFRTATAEMREYIAVPLLEPLIEGRAYAFTMYVNQPNDVELATDGIGVRFSAGPLTAPNASVLPYDAHIERTPGALITDTAAWVPISGCYTAQGGEDHLTIGNFRTDANTAHTVVHPGAWYAGCGYFLIDDVSLVPLPELDLGPDTALCTGAELPLIAAPEGALYHWSDGSDGPTLTVQGAGTYWLQATLGGCVLSDTVHVEEGHTTFPDLGPDRSLCQGERITLDVHPLADEALVWDDGSTTASREIGAPGRYWVRIEGPCGMATDSVAVVRDDCSWEVFVPNVFTPNGDAINDVFQPVFDPRMTAVRYTVFDRWGTEVFIAPTGEGWDASGAPIGIYAVRWESTRLRGTPESRSGLAHVCLVR